VIVLATAETGSGIHHSLSGLPLSSTTACLACWLEKASYCQKLALIGTLYFVGHMPVDFDISSISMCCECNNFYTID